MLRVVVRRAPEHFDGQQGFLEFGVPSLQVALDHKAQKAGQTLIPGKSGTCEDAVQLPQGDLTLSFAQQMEVSPEDSKGSR